MQDLRSICKDYLKGIQFVMYYYYHGCPSWIWYYPYFMSPMLSDLITILEELLEEEPEMEFTFERGEPFRPFNQLLFILPKASINLMPKVYSDMIFKEGSKIEKFYPEEYDFDPFDSLKDYAWIPDIEVIDKALIDEALKDLDYDSLSERDKFRNRRGDDILYRFDPKAEIKTHKSTLNGIGDVSCTINI